MSDPVRCPNCESTSIQAVPINSKSVGDAVVAQFLFGFAAGVTAGQGQTVIVNACLNCGLQWQPGVTDVPALMAHRRAQEAARLEAAQKAASKQAKSESTDGLGLNILLGAVLLVVVMLWLLSMLA